jgi:hypothetical protein
MKKPKIEKSLEAEFMRVAIETLDALKASRAAGRKDAFLEDQRLSGNPHLDGWLRLSDILSDAKDDERVLSSPGASAFLGVVKQITLMTCMQLVNGNVENDAFVGVKAFRPLAADLAGYQLRDNSGRIKGGETMKLRKVAHTKLLTDAVEDILKNPATSDWRDPEIARWLMEAPRAFHSFNGRELTEKTMTARVKEIREIYKASI